MKKLLKMLGIALSFLLYKWLVVVIELVARLCRKCKKAKQDKRELPRHIRKASNSKCNPLRHPNYHRPDPLIYSQGYLKKQGLAVTWNNPDIQLYLNGNPVSSHALQPETVYEIRARCWNASYDAPVVGMPVRFSFLSFGAGAASNPIGHTFVSLGVIGGSDNPNFASVPWKTPAGAGHYCIQVRLEWGDDSNPGNNMGQENTNVVKAQSPAAFDFMVRNDDRRGHHFRIETDVYTLPPLLDCAEVRKQGRRKEEIIRERHGEKNFPVPPGWIIQYDAATFDLAPGHERTVQVKVEPPGDFKGEQAINFNVLDERDLLTGGVTVIIQQG
jgi:hypothetical protein